MNFDLDFYKGKKVFVTGHTGFKGSWLCKMLANAGAIVTGYSLNPPTSPSLFEIAGIEQDVHSVIGDIRDFKTLKAAFDEAQPEMVLHLAAQPIVRDSYKDPAYTYETNVMGTVNILECVRTSNCVKSFLNVTTDKVYLNKEWAWGYRENEELDGFDPYSNSKSFVSLPWLVMNLFNFVFRRSSSEYISILIQNVIVVIVDMIVCYAICQMVHLGGIMTIIFRGAVCVVFSNISYFAIWKNNEDFKDAIKLLNSIFKGKR